MVDDYYICNKSTIMNTMDICVSQHILYVYYFLAILTVHSLLHETKI